MYAFYLGKQKDYRFVGCQIERIALPSLCRPPKTPAITEK
jgi:hypothetical protein